ncbi:MAG: class I tRNA ligase family protein, partial [Anaerolineales bacterium]|nr:class I tRNA ligase family protein [Anaerolineales bacterium]
LGNVIDPLQVMDEYGTDALRFTLLTGSTPGNDMNLSLERVKANRNFANKIWNAARYVIGKLGSLPAEEEAAASPPTLSDRWILARLDQTIADCTRLIGKHQYGQAGSAAYEFVWSEYADWYLEVSKQQLKQPRTALTTARTLVSGLDDTLRLLHPYVPFVTEEIWQHLKTAAGERFAPDGGWPDALIVAPWPEVKTTPPRDDDIADFHAFDGHRARHSQRTLRKRSGCQTAHCGDNYRWRRRSHARRATRSAGRAGAACAAAAGDQRGQRGEARGGHRPRGG